MCRRKSKGNIGFRARRQASELAMRCDALTQASSSYSADSSDRAACVSVMYNVRVFLAVTPFAEMANRCALLSFVLSVCAECGARVSMRSYVAGTTDECTTDKRIAVDDCGFVCAHTNTHAHEVTTTHTHTDSLSDRARA